MLHKYFIFVLVILFLIPFSSSSMLPPWSQCDYHNLTEYYSNVSLNSLKLFPGGEIQPWCTCEDRNCSDAVISIKGNYVDDITYIYDLEIKLNKTGNFFISPIEFGSLEKIIEIKNRLDSYYLIKEIKPLEKDESIRLGFSGGSISYVDSFNGYYLYFNYINETFVLNDFILCFPYDLASEETKEIKAVRENSEIVGYVEQHDNLVLCQFDYPVEVKLYSPKDPYDGLIISFSGDEITDIQSGNPCVNSDYCAEIAKEKEKENVKLKVMGLISLILISTLFFILWLARIVKNEKSTASKIFSKLWKKYNFLIVGLFGGVLIPLVWGILSIPGYPLSNAFWWNLGPTRFLNVLLAEIAFSALLGLILGFVFLKTWKNKNRLEPYVWILWLIFLFKLVFLENINAGFFMILLISIIVYFLRSRSNKKLRLIFLLAYLSLIPLFLSMGWVGPFIEGELIGDVGFIKPSNTVKIPLKPIELVFGRYFEFFVLVSPVSIPIIFAYYFVLWYIIFYIFHFIKEKRASVNKRKSPKKSIANSI